MLEQSQRVAQPPKANRGYGVPSREPTLDLRPLAVRGSSGSAGEYDRMERGHPRIAKGCEDLALVIGARSPVLVAAENETALEESFRLTLQSVIDDIHVDAENSVRGWSSLAPFLARYYTRGAFVGCLRFVDSSRSQYRVPLLNGLGVECYPVSLSSVADWRVDPATNRLLEVTQQTSTGRETLQASSLLHLQHGGEVGEFEGISILRPLVMPFERWASILLASERGSHLGAGVLIYQQPLSGGDEAGTGLEWLDACGLPYIALPPHAAPNALSLMNTAGSKEAPADLMRYIDEQIDRVFDAAVQSLVASQNGSRAVGEELGDDADEVRASSLLVLLRCFVGRLGSWLAEHVGYHGRLPDVALSVDDGESAAERISLLVPAVTAGLITWSQEDEAELRVGAGLPERTVVTEARVLNGAQIQAAQSIVGAMTPADPMQSPMAPGAALELLMAAGVPVESARNLINAQLVSMGKPLLPAVEQAAAVAHDAPSRPATLADASGNGKTTITVTGADGLPYESSVELSDVERYVEWATIDNQRNELDDKLTTDIERLATMHRAEVAAALADGWQSGERDAVWEVAKNRYLATIVAYRNKTQVVVAEHARREMERQVAAGVPRAPAGRGTSDLSQVAANTHASSILAAETIANRVQSEVEAAWSAGQSLASFRSRITPAGLTAGARGVGAEVESNGRIEAARDMAKADGGDGLVILGMIRSSVRDRNRCNHCALMHGTMLEMPQDRAAFEAMPLPDPDCAGRAERCRCGWLLRWGRR